MIPTDLRTYVIFYDRPGEKRGSFALTVRADTKESALADFVRVHSGAVPRFIALAQQGIGQLVSAIEQPTAYAVGGYARVTDA